MTYWFVPKDILHLQILWAETFYMLSICITDFSIYWLISKPQLCSSLDSFTWRISQVKNKRARKFWIIIMLYIKKSQCIWETWYIGQLYLKSSLFLWKIYRKHSTEGFRFSNGSADWALLFEIYTPSVLHVGLIYHRGCIYFKWKCPVGWSIWNWYSPCEMLMVNLPQGECRFQIEQPNIKQNLAFLSSQFISKLNW